MEQAFSVQNKLHRNFNVKLVYSHLDLYLNVIFYQQIYLKST